MSNNGLEIRPSMTLNETLSLGTIDAGRPEKGLAADSAIVENMELKSGASPQDADKAGSQAMAGIVGDNPWYYDESHYLQKDFIAEDFAKKRKDAVDSANDKYPERTEGIETQRRRVELVPIARELVPDFDNASQEDRDRLIKALSDKQNQDVAAENERIRLEKARLAEEQEKRYAELKSQIDGVIGKIQSAEKLSDILPSASEVPTDAETSLAPELTAQDLDLAPKTPVEPDTAYSESYDARHLSDEPKISNDVWQSEIPPAPEAPPEQGATGPTGVGEAIDSEADHNGGDGVG